jgi:ribonucleotide reductase beta subunit family protein with ferritin-like domain
VQELADKHLDVAAETLYARLEHHVSRLESERDEDTFLQAVVVYHLIAEGVVARTAQNLAAPMYERFGDFPGLTNGQRLVARDEARHIGIGVSYCRGRMSADPDHARELVSEVIEEFTDVAMSLLGAAQQEDMAELVRAGYGVEPEGFYGEAMRLLDLRLRSIGYFQ